MSKKLIVLCTLTLCFFIIWCNSQQDESDLICTEWNNCADAIESNNGSNTSNKSYREVEIDEELEVEQAQTAEKVNEESNVYAWNRNW